VAVAEPEVAAAEVAEVVSSHPAAPKSTIGPSRNSD
jgi:hypothetical protein